MALQYTTCVLFLAVLTWPTCRSHRLEVNEQQLVLPCPNTSYKQGIKTKWDLAHTLHLVTQNPRPPVTYQLQQWKYQHTSEILATNLLSAYPKAVSCEFNLQAPPHVFLGSQRCFMVLCLWDVQPPLSVSDTMLNRRSPGAWELYQTPIELGGASGSSSLSSTTALGYKLQETLHTDIPFMSWEEGAGRKRDEDQDRSQILR